MVDAFIEIAIEKLVGLGEDELKLLRGTREEVEKLLNILQRIRPYLHDAEVKQFIEPEVGVWLKKLKYVAYEADNVLDEWQTKSQQQSTGANRVWNFFAQCICFHQLALRHTVGKKIQKINGKLDEIDNQSKTLNFLKRTVMGEGINFPSVIRNARQTNSKVEEIFGREVEINGIKDKLKNSSETSKLAVVSIVGPPGFGKTTLAKYVFNDCEIVQHFEERIWVCVSDEFDVTSIMKKLIEAAKGNPPSASENQEALQKKIADEVLKDKLFLLVLDDVWNEDYVKWEKLFNAIKNCGLRGSRILVTTRSENVCRIMKSLQTFQVGIVLSDEHCWSIFESVVLESRDKSEHPELKMVGKKIVKKCKGVPLAIKTVAGVILKTAITIEDWENVLKSDMWDWEPKLETSILPALLLSYYYLSPPLKQCFRYCAIHPKDYIRKDEIVQQWIAHGYISEKKNMEMEDVGENYFYEFLARSLFQEPRLDKYNNVIYCRMHDLVHNLAQFVTKGEFLLINNEENVKFDTQYPPLHCRISDVGLLKNIKIDVLRTFISETYKREVGSQIKEMQHLRVLELDVGSLKIFPVVAKLVHLRYLNLSGPKFKGIPSSIGELHNLLYLILSWTSIEALPVSIGMLRKLRHLDLSCNENLKALPSTIGRLTNLRKLDLNDTRLDEIPSSIGDLQNLLYLDLSENENLKALPSIIGRLTNLRKLNLESTGRLDEIPDCIGKLASLQVLDVSSCQNLERLPESIKDLSRLQVLDVSRCEKLKKLPHGIFDKKTGLKQLGVSGSGLRGLPAGIGKQTHFQSLDEFRVAGNHDGSSSSSSNIWELGDLDQLHGSLRIRNLDMVTSGEEAARAQLHNKNSLTWLALEWNNDGRGEAKEKTTSEDVLQALRPCPTLRQLEIEGYPGCTVPTWLGNSTTLILSGLQELSLKSWDGHTNLPALGNLPELRQLEIRGMPKVRRVGAEWSGSNHGFRKLEYLQFQDMAEWEEWDILDEKLFFPFPCLSILKIWNCPKLRSLPSLPNLEHLMIGGDDGTMSELSNDLINKLGALKKLEISDCPNLESLPQEKASLKQLQTLEIRNCGKLQSLPSLPNLEHLTIDRDDGTVSELSNDLVNKLRALKTLEIQDCPNLESLPQEMASLKQLQTLEIWNCGKLRSLPSLPNLEYLTIGNDGTVSELSNDLVNKLGALKMLEIDDCPNLESLPQEMASLKQLQTLKIWTCPKLEESCNKEGAQWYKIEHIPCIKINGQDVRQNA